MRLMRNTLRVICIFGIVACLRGQVVAAAEISGDQVVWHPVTISFEGPDLSESTEGTHNPFMNYRLNVTFLAPDGNTHVVPGFFAGDGQGGGSGNIWQVRLAADVSGTWQFQASFRQGTEVAVSLDQNAGTPTSFDGESGQFTISPLDPNAPGFLKWGLLEYVGTHYLRFRNGPYFIKSGTDSPENFFGYAGFDNTIDQGGIGTPLLNTPQPTTGLHRYEAHIQDALPDDPYFVSDHTGYDSRGITGALNYLSSVGVNSIYFLPMNLGGDGQETYPFISPNKRLNYDVSKLDQWNMVFEHATRRGIALHFVLQEMESANQNYLNFNERLLYHREMIARFAHNLAIKWNISEEWNLGTEQWKIDALVARACYINDLDPYDHYIGVHHIPTAFDDYYPLLVGEPCFQASSMQYYSSNASDWVEQWRAESVAAGQPWVLDMDENFGTPLVPNKMENLRKTTLYDVYFSGGNIEYYAGYGDPAGGDVDMEEFYSREPMWIYTRIAREFMEDHLPFWEMQPNDNLLVGESSAYGGGELFFKQGEVYAAYLPSAFDTASINVVAGDYIQRWFNPRTGSFEGDVTLISGSGVTSIGDAPFDKGNDWIALLQSPQAIKLTLVGPDIDQAADQISLSILGGLPQEELFLLVGTEPGQIVLPGCFGMHIGLGAEDLSVIPIRVDDQGMFNFVADLPSEASGLTFYVQIASLNQCEVSEVRQVTLP